jgi:CrcB protein
MLTVAHAALVLVGGGIGSAARYGALRLGLRLRLHASSALLAVNLIGCFIAGAGVQLLGSGAWAGSDGDAARMFVLGGLMGGFTTFSAVSLECATTGGSQRRFVWIECIASVAFATPFAFLGMRVAGGGW